MAVVPASVSVERLAMKRGVCVTTWADGGSYANVSNVIAGLQELRPWIMRCNVTQGDTGQRTYINAIRAACPWLKISGIVGKPWQGGAQADAQAMVDWLATYPAGTFSYFEGCNEWNMFFDQGPAPRPDGQGGRPTWYANIRAYHQAIYPKLKARFPGIPVIQPSLGKREGYSLMGNLAGTCDLGNAHAYTGGNAPGTSGDRITGEIANVRTICGPDPKLICVTEWGWHNKMDHVTGGHKPTPPDVAAIQCLPYFCEYDRTDDIAWMSNYELVDDRAEAPGDEDGGRHERHFGLFELNFTAIKAQGAAHRNVGRIIERAYSGSVSWGACTIAVTGASDAAVMVYHRPDGRKIICLWRRGVVIYNNNTRLMVSPAPAAQNVTVTFSAARKVDTFKPHDSSDPIASLSSTSTTTVTVPLVAEGAMLVVGPTGSTPPDPEDQTVTATFTVGGSSVSGSYVVTP